MQTEFRNAMAQLSAAVNIITTAGPYGRAGLTVSAVCSVSDTPPTLLVCLNRGSALYPVFTGNRRLGVNILPGHHEELARQFAGMTGLSMEQRLSSAGWTSGDGSMPVLSDALASLEGDIVLTQDIGSHCVMFAEIKHIRLSASQDGLTYFNRRFHRLAGGLSKTT
ncbi:flavin reductase [Herbaspirillum sp. RV1423]|uniref:flavin reductase n=1 Tax=Herbaspirillum sp. RV1423 TaxID=1443993 RepID=UPI0004BC62ED|nr:flavin reductase [Herbaspirillum sp. RV1423]